MPRWNQYAVAHHPYSPLPTVIPSTPKLGKGFLQMPGNIDNERRGIEAISHQTTAGTSLTGTVTKTAGLTTLLGSGTTFLTHYLTGMRIRVPNTAGGQSNVILSITDNTHLQVANPWGASGSGQSHGVHDRFIDCMNASGFQGAVINDWGSDIEGTQGVYDWSHIDSEIALLEDVSNWLDGKRKVAMLRVFLGEKAPAWSYGSLPRADPEFGSMGLTPLPWLEPYKTNAENFIAALGARYDSSATVISVRISSVGTNAAEMALADDSPRADGQGLGLAVWHDHTLWSPQGQASEVFTEAKMLAVMKASVLNYVDALPNTPGFLGLNTYGFRDASRGYNMVVASAFLDWLDTLPVATRNLILQGWTEFDNVLTSGATELVDRMAASASLVYSHFDLGNPDPDNEASHQATVASLVDWGAGHVNLRPRTLGWGPADNSNRNHHAWARAIDQSVFAGEFHT